jgi:exonuclease VII small subunit
VKNDKTNEKTIEQMMAELNERIAWFQGDDFNLDEAKQRFVEARQLAKDITAALDDMQHDITVLSEDFSA